MMEDICDVCLVNMPFADVRMPSLALSIFKSSLAERGICGKVQYEHIYFAQKCGLLDYEKIVYSHTRLLAGEIIFARAAHGHTLSDIEEYKEYIQKDILSQNCIPETFREEPRKWAASFPRLQEMAVEFVREAALRILRQKPKIVALSSLFHQINANIAIARRLKELAPHIVIMVGGPNCTGEAGLALLDHVEAVDYIFCGEADEIFAEVCERILRFGRIPPADLPYGLLSREAERPDEIIYRLTRDMNAVPVPDFSDFFRIYEQSGLPQEVANVLVEGSRGCWWGRKKPCTFCGLNGPSRSYRHKDTERLADEIASLAAAWPKTKKFYFTDAILSTSHVGELPAALKKRGIFLDFFAEVKSNLTPDELLSLAEAGFARLQPGIESLQDDLLQLMNKGCRAIKQVELLKNCRTYHVEAIWNLLCGFPGEREEYLAETAELIPKITHLTPPNQLNPIVFQRYGEYTDHAAEYGLVLRPFRSYDFAFADRDFIQRTAYYFEPVDLEERLAYHDCTRRGSEYRRTRDWVTRWVQGMGNADRLDMEVAEGGVDLYDMRGIAKKSVYHLQGLGAALYLACRGARSEKGLLEEFSTEHEAGAIREKLAWLAEENLLLHIGDEYLSLAIDRGEARRIRKRRLPLMRIELIQERERLMQCWAAGNVGEDSEREGERWESWKSGT